MASGDQTTTGTSGNDHLNGGSGSDTLLGGAGNDFLNGGSGNDVLNGQSGSDRVDGDSGNDVLIYNMSENAGATDIYDGGSGIDTLRLVLTNAQYQSAAVQTDLANLQQFLNSNTLPNSQANNREFRFTAFDLSVSKIENLQIEVVGGANHAPVAVADTNEADAVVEFGVNPGNSPFAGDSSATGNVLTNDTDVDAGDSMTVTAVNGSAANVGTSINGTYGSLTLGSDGEWTYSLHNVDADTNALAQGEAATEVFTYTVSDSAGATSSTTLTINLSGTNDAPTIDAGGDISAAFKEDTVVQAAGDLDATDVDHNAELTWSIVGGTSALQDFRFEMDNLRIVRNGNLFFEDTFGDNNAPPSAPNLVGGNMIGYNVTGGHPVLGIGAFAESAGRLFLDGHRAVALTALGLGNAGVNAQLMTNTNPSSPNGLKFDTDFTVEGQFNLVLPVDSGEGYGIRLTDRNSPTSGDSTVALTVQNDGGTIHVNLRQIDFFLGTQTVLQSLNLTPLAGDDQIVLRLDHDGAGMGATPGVVRAAFDLLDNGVITSSASFFTTGSIFTGDNPSWTQVRIDASGPTEDISVRQGTYVDSHGGAGRWLDRKAPQQSAGGAGAGAGRNCHRNLQRPGDRRARRQ